MQIKMTIDTICVPSEDVVAREIEDDMIIVPLVTGISDAEDELYTLNETGKAIWRKFDGKLTLGQVAESLTQQFFSPAGEIIADVLGFANEMVRRGIFTIKQ